MYIYNNEDIAAGEREEARILRRSLTESRHSLQECEASLQEVLHNSELHETGCIDLAKELDIAKREILSLEMMNDNFRLKFAESSELRLSSPCSETCSYTASRSSDHEHPVTLLFNIILLHILNI